MAKFVEVAAFDRREVTTIASAHSLQQLAEQVCLTNLPGDQKVIFHGFSAGEIAKQHADLARSLKRAKTVQHAPGRNAQQGLPRKFVRVVRQRASI